MYKVYYFENYGSEENQEKMRTSICDTEEKLQMMEKSEAEGSIEIFKVEVAL